MPRVLELAVRAEHLLAGHADHDPHVRVRRAQALDGEQRRQEVGVAGGAGGVEVDAVGARLPQLASATCTMSSTASSTACSWAARASSMRSCGSSVDQFPQGPSGAE